METKLEKVQVRYFDEQQLLLVSSGDLFVLIILCLIDHIFVIDVIFVAMMSDVTFFRIRVRVRVKVRV